MGTTKKRRPALDERTRLTVWVAAGGRCTFCNRIVLENDDIGELVPIGELAHSVGWDTRSPRGQSDLTDAERSAPENLVLLCGTCHKPVDDRGVVGRYTVDILGRMKREHEARIRTLTDIGGDRCALVVRVVGPIRGASPELTYKTVLEATTAAGYFPQLLPSQHRSAVELDLRELGEGSPEISRICAQRIDDLAQRIRGAVLHDDVHRLAVFGYARIPLLVHLGARLDDKVGAAIFQRQRHDDRNAWAWPALAAPPPDFAWRIVEGGPDRRGPLLILNVSGTISLADVPTDLAQRGPIYVVEPVAPRTPGPTLIDSPAALAALERALRALFAAIEASHGRLDALPVFGALPVSAAITLGRVLMPQVTPVLHIYDRGSDGTFFLALEVTK